MDPTAEGLTKAVVTFRKAAERLWAAMDHPTDPFGPGAEKDEATQRSLTDAAIDAAEDAEAAALEMDFDAERTVELAQEDRKVTGNLFRLAYDRYHGRDPDVRNAVRSFLSALLSRARRRPSARAQAPAVQAAPATVHPTARKVVIGHGRSAVWREVKDLLQDTLQLQVDEFDSVAVAGMSIKERLVQMKNEAGIAFIIMTAEDEQADGRVRARQNVVHEVGYFQGALGFERAIILLEEGCEKFSNVDGIVYIGFPKGHISAAFEKIRLTLQREGYLVGLPEFERAIQERLQKLRQDPERLALVDQLLDGTGRSRKKR